MKGKRLNSCMLTSDAKLFRYGQQCYERYYVVMKMIGIIMCVVNVNP